MFAVVLTMFIHTRIRSFIHPLILYLWTRSRCSRMALKPVTPHGSRKPCIQAVAPCGNPGKLFTSLLSEAMMIRNSTIFLLFCILQQVLTQRPQETLHFCFQMQFGTESFFFKCINHIKISTKANKIFVFLLMCFLSILRQIKQVPFHCLNLFFNTCLKSGPSREIFHQHSNA